MFLLLTNILSTKYKGKKEGQKVAVQPALTKENMCMNHECLSMNLLTECYVFHVSRINNF